MKTPKISYLLLTMLSLMIFSSLALADSITLVDSSNPAVRTQITTTTSADGKTLGLTFTNLTDPSLKVGILQVFFGPCGSCTVTSKSITFSDPALTWIGPYDLGGGFTFSSQSRLNLLTTNPSQTLLNDAGKDTVLSGVTGTISLSFSTAVFLNGLSAQTIGISYMYQDASGNSQRGVPAGTAPVPEPATLILLGSGLAALGARAHKRRR